MKEKQLFILAVLVFATIYGALTIGFGLFVTDWSSWLGVVFFLGFELLFIGIASEQLKNLALFVRNLDLQGF